jgi:hypothetical protein
VHDIGGFMGKTKMFRNNNSATSGFFKMTEPSAEEIGPPPVLPLGIIIICVYICIYIYMYIELNINMYIFKYMYIDICIYEYIYMYISLLLLSYFVL